MPPKMTRKMAKMSKDVYRGYIPPDLPQNRPPNRIKPWWRVLGKPRVTMYPPPEIEEWSEEPEYPRVVDLDWKKQVRLDWYDSIKNLPTVDQKQYEIAHHARHYTANMNNWLLPAHSLPYAKYLTRTHLVRSMPREYTLPTSADEDQLSEPPHATPSRNERDTRIRDIVLDHIRSSKYQSDIKHGKFFVSRPARDGNSSHFKSNSFIENLVNQLRKTMVPENPQLLDYQIDLSPSVRSWWYHSGFEAPNNKVFYKSRKDEDGNINQIFQINGSAALNMRSEHLMEPIVAMNDPLVTDTTLVEKCSYNPRYYGAKYKFKWPVALPGFWNQEDSQFDCPHTTFLSTDCLNLRDLCPNSRAKSLNDVEDCLNSQAMLTSFAWLNSLAMYHGYTPFQQIDYPLTCQAITTDGKDWLFNIYQFNTGTFHRDLGGPKLNNICWSSGLMKLYGDYNDGKFIDVNEDVIKLLVKYLTKQVSPEYTQLLDMRPHLSADCREEGEKEKTRKQLRDLLEQRYNRWESKEWYVPEFEHIFFRSKPTRYRITTMKPYWHIPRPKIPAIFE